MITLNCRNDNQRVWSSAETYRWAGCVGAISWGRQRSQRPSATIGPEKRNEKQKWKTGKHMLDTKGTKNCFSLQLLTAKIRNVSFYFRSSKQDNWLLYRSNSATFTAFQSIQLHFHSFHPSLPWGLLRLSRSLTLPLSEWWGGTRLGKVQALCLIHVGLLSRLSHTDPGQSCSSILHVCVRLSGCVPWRISLCVCVRVSQNNPNSSQAPIFCTKEVMPTFEKRQRRSGQVRLVRSCAGCPTDCFLIRYIWRKNSLKKKNRRSGLPGRVIN